MLDAETKRCIDSFRNMLVGKVPDPKSQVEQITISVPDLETQRAIVAEIEAEQALVAASRELIRRMEAKVKAAIDRVWVGA